MPSALPPATRAIIAVNVVAFLLQQYYGNAMVALFALWPLSSTLFQPWQLITYAFLHGSLAHIFFNMFALFMFGRALEYFWGSRRFTIFYLACVIAAAATQLLTASLAGSMEATLGASGGVFGLLLAFAMYFPRQRITLLFPPIPMPAWLFVTLYGVLELVLGVTNTQAGVAHFAHLGGMLGGALVILYWRARRLPRS
jgi:membrane associated rhomboid family serine protease